MPTPDTTTQADLDTAKAMREAWSRLCFDMDELYHMPPAGMTIERIAEARKLLGV